MYDGLDYQVHISANSHERDWALRATITAYDIDGNEDGHRTIRAHDTMPRVDDLDIQLLFVIATLYAMVRKRVITGPELDDEPDQPLPTL